VTGGEPAPLSVKGVCLDAGGRVLVCRNWRREFPDGYRDAARLWQERRAMSHN
jgi:hypothetical protein